MSYIMCQNEITYIILKSFPNEECGCEYEVDVDRDAEVELRLMNWK